MTYLPRRLLDAQPCTTCGQPRAHHGIWPTYLRVHRGRRYDLRHAFVVGPECPRCTPRANGPTCDRHTLASDAGRQA